RTSVGPTSPDRVIRGLFAGPGEKNRGAICLSLSAGTSKGETIVTNGRALRAWGSLGGLAFVVLFVIGSALIFDGPNGDESPAKWIAFYGDSGHRDRINIGWILAGLGVFCFLWFVASLRDTVRRATVVPESDST